jgi:primosomal protein N' (replication factor Y)
MHDTILTHFGEGDADMLVGTQMVAKGHDFPNVTLVGVLNADLGLGIPDFRAPERTFQLLTQVAGRSGRGRKKGEVIIQTYYPDHFCIKQARKQDFIAYYEEEIHFRRLMKLPPYYALANIIITGKTAERARKNAEKAGRHLEDGLSGEARMLGPAPAPLYRLRNIYRHQIILKDPSRIRLRAALKKALQNLSAARFRQQDITIDIDPYHLM